MGTGSALDAHSMWTRLAPRHPAQCDGVLSKMGQGEGFLAALWHLLFAFSSGLELVTNRRKN